MDFSGYRYSDAACGRVHDYVLPALTRMLASLNLESKRAFDLGCGNGAVAHWLASRGYETSGVDPSESGIVEANRAYPSLDLRVGSAYDSLHETFGTYPLLVSIEVVEHVYAPRDYAALYSNLLEPNGYALISTPYHGYLKNLALAVTGQMDSHFTALWDHGHIKFWSRRTITKLLNEFGLTVLQIKQLGRMPQIAKTMLVLAQKCS